MALSVTIGVVFLLIIAGRSCEETLMLRGEVSSSRKGNYEIVEVTGLYWHFVDLVWVFIFALFYLW